MEKALPCLFKTGSAPSATAIAKTTKGVSIERRIIYILHVRKVTFTELQIDITVDKLV